MPLSLPMTTRPEERVDARTMKIHSSKEIRLRMISNLLKGVVTHRMLTSIWRDYDGHPFRENVERRFLLRCELDAAFFHFYGITRDGAVSDRYQKPFLLVREGEFSFGADRRSNFRYMMTTTEPTPAELQAFPWRIEPVLDASSKEAGC